MSRAPKTSSTSRNLRMAELVHSMNNVLAGSIPAAGAALEASNELHTRVALNEIVIAMDQLASLTRSLSLQIAEDGPNQDL